VSSLLRRVRLALLRLKQLSCTRVSFDEPAMAAIGATGFLLLLVVLMLC
jgi:hypothetical protein